MSVMSQVLQVAKNEIGYLEKASKNNLYSKTANAGSANYTKYWEEIASYLQGEPWCACFVTWTLVQVVGKEKAKKMLKHYPFISCPKISTLFTLNSKPKVGDIVIFYRKGVFAHTGWVSAVNGNTITTIEGNTSGASGIVPNGGGVVQKRYELSSIPGSKFITLDWPAEEFTETAVSLKGTITSNDLNVRKSPNTNSEVLAKHKKGDIVTISAKTNNGWYKVKYPFGIGYISSQYVKTSSIEPEETLTQEEFNQLMNNWLKQLSKENPSTYSKDAREYVEKIKIINGDSNGSKRYHSYLSREEMAQILFNLHEENII